jgi:hypothetical protein
LSVAQHEGGAERIAGGRSGTAVEQSDEGRECGNVFDAIPDRDGAAPTGNQHARHFADRLLAIRKEHEAELAHDCVEGAVRRRQCLGGPLLPIDGG